MRMKCQFCNAPCFLDRDQQESTYTMIWECRNHPTVISVRHYVAIQHRKRRFDDSKTGTIREWFKTRVTWKTDKGDIYKAYYTRFDDSGEYVPGKFYVTVEPDMFEFDEEEDVLELDDYPPWTVEQLPQKIAILSILS